MSYPHAVTCCYCNSSVLLDPRCKKRRSLTCENCGAPLRHAPTEQDRARHAKPMRAVQPMPMMTANPAAEPKRKKAKASSKKSKRKKAFGFGRVMKEVWDEIEDIFD